MELKKKSDFAEELQTMVHLQTLGSLQSNVKVLKHSIMHSCLFAGARTVLCVILFSER